MATNLNPYHYSKKYMRPELFKEYLEEIFGEGNWKLRRNTPHGHWTYYSPTELSDTQKAMIREKMRPEINKVRGDDATPPKTGEASA